MKIIKKVWEENRVLMVLAIILVICLIVFITVALTYFYGSSDNVYGNRLDITEKVPLNDKLLKDIKDDLRSKDNIESAEVTKKGKVVYINITFIPAVAMDVAKKVAEESISLFNDDELEVYDIQFTITSASGVEVEGYTLMGARNASGSGIVIWNNYNKNLEEGSAE